jgi:Dyp-type peroxidase family
VIGRRRRGAAPTLELADIQGGVLRGYAHRCADYRLVRFEGDPGAARAWLARVADAVTSAEPWTRGKPMLAVNVALTAPGLQHLGVGLDGFAGEFVGGMAARADRLGDTGHCAPDGWEEGLGGTGEGHALVWVHGRQAAPTDARADELLDGLPGRVVFAQDTAMLPFGREHFGFSDGFAQPSVASSGQENRPGEGVPLRFGRWRLLKPGELVLGYEDEDGLLPPAPPGVLGRNGTYMVLRKLRQDVAAWKAWVARTAGEHVAGNEDWLAAQVVGRWPDGTPLELVPGPKQDRTITDLHELNAFRFARGSGEAPFCPAGAHIRRTNPRDGLSGGAARTRRHRIVRRGMPYGPPHHGEEDDGVDRGLLFACFNASIARQFEVVQSWMAGGNVFGLGPHDRDVLAGAGDGSGGFTLRGVPPARVPGPGRPLVAVRGGEYLFLPSLSGLRAIAAGEAAG